MRSLADCVFANEELAGALSSIVEGSAFAAEAARRARALNVALPAELNAGRRRPDALEVARSTASPSIGSALPSRHWLPVAVGAAPEGIAVDWAWVGPEPLRASFYEDEIRRASALPFNRAFRYRTRLDDLVAHAGDIEGRKPDGFIFHMSRCGSTLVAQMLASLPDAIVISEAAPIDTVVQRGRCGEPDVATQVLRVIITAFGRKRTGDERRYVVKLDAWHSLALPLFRRAFPDVPWVFLYRDPVEVLVSQMRQRGMQMVPSYFPPSFYGIADADCSLNEDYYARVLAAVCRAAIDHAALGGGLFLNYDRLPEAVLAKILPHFAIVATEDERKAMRDAARRNAKAPSFGFVRDGPSKQQVATAAVRRAADVHLNEVYQRLEELAGAPIA